MWAIVFSGIILLIFYLPSFTEGYFLIDDDVLVGAPQVAANVDFWIKLKQILVPSQHYDYYPLRDLSYIFDWMWGLNLEVNLLPAKLQNLFWLLLCGVAMVRILRLFAVNEQWILLLTFVWLVHPYNAEMLVWVSARKDLMALALGLWGVYGWLKFDRTAPASDAPSSFRFTLTTGLFTWLCFVGSGFSKASFVLLPPAYLSYFILFKERPRHRRSLWLLVLISVSTLSIAALQKKQYGAVNNMYFAYTLDYRLQAAITAFGKMVAGLFYFPANVVDGENWGEWADLNRPYFWWGLLLLFGLVGLTWRQRQNKNWWRFLILFASLYATIPGVNVYHRNFYSTRYLAPLTFGALLVFAYHWAQRHPFPAGRRRGTTLALIFVYLGALWSEAQNWNSNEAIWKKSVAQNQSQPNLVYLLMLSHLNQLRWGQLEPEDRRQLEAGAMQLLNICTTNAQISHRNGSLCFYYWSMDFTDLEKRAPWLPRPTKVQQQLFLDRYNEEARQLSEHEALSLPTSASIKDSRAFRRYLSMKTQKLTNTTPEWRAFALIDECLNGEPALAQQHFHELQGAGLLRAKDLIEAAEQATLADEQETLKKCFFSPR